MCFALIKGAMKVFKVLGCLREHLDLRSVWETGAAQRRNYGIDGMFFVCCFLQNSGDCERKEEKTKDLCGFFLCWCCWNGAEPPAFCSKNLFIFISSPDCCWSWSRVRSRPGRFFPHTKFQIFESLSANWICFVTELLSVSVQGEGGAIMFLLISVYVS